jgi:hypothetical protein
MQRARIVLSVFLPLFLFLFRFGEINIWHREMRRLFQHIRLLVEQRRPLNVSAEAARDSAWQGVSAFCFLRFLVPAILRPHLFGLVPGASISCSTPQDSMNSETLCGCFQAYPTLRLAVV